MVGVGDEFRIGDRGRPFGVPAGPLELWALLDPALLGLEEVPGFGVHLKKLKRVVCCGIFNKYSLYQVCCQ